MIRLTVVVGVVIGIMVGLIATGGRGVVSAVVVIALAKRFGPVSHGRMEGEHTWLLVPELVTS